MAERYSRRYKRDKRPVKIYFMEIDGYKSSQLLTNAHVLTQFHNILTLLLTTYHCRHPKAYEDTVLNELRSLGLSPNHPVLGWISESEKNYRWFLNYCIGIIERYRVLVPRNKLIRSIDRIKLIDRLAYGLKHGGTWLTTFPFHITWSDLNQVIGRHTHEVARDRYFNDYHHLGVFCKERLGSKVTYPASFVDFLDKRNLPYNKLVNDTPITKTRTTVEDIELLLENYTLQAVEF